MLMLVQPEMEASSVDMFVGALREVPYKADRLGQYRVLTSWADYLVNTLLFIHDQYVCLHQCTSQR
jgi:hypothetical protein